MASTRQTISWQTGDEVTPSTTGTFELLDSRQSRPSTCVTYSLFRSFSLVLNEEMKATDAQLYRYRYRQNSNLFMTGTCRRHILPGLSKPTGTVSAVKGSCDSPSVCARSEPGSSQPTPSRAVNCSSYRAFYLLALHHAGQLSAQEWRVQNP